MTCIVGMTHEEEVYMAADSCAGNGYVSVTCKTNKLVKRMCGKGADVPVLFGGCGRWRDIQIVAYRLSIPDPDEYRSLEGFMFELCKNLSESLEDSLALEKSDEVGALRSSFLVGVRNRLFVVQGDLSFYESEHLYNAIGSGAEVALGSLHRSFANTHEIEPKPFLMGALHASAEFCSSVRPPFYMESTR